MQTNSHLRHKASRTLFVGLVALYTPIASATECLPVNTAKLGERLGISSSAFEASANATCSANKKAATASSLSEGIAANGGWESAEPTRCRSSLRSFCTELKTAQFNVPSGKEWMPTVPGLTPRAIKVKRNHISFHYTFK
jgi:hypothetical protein